MGNKKIIKILSMITLILILIFILDGLNISNIEYFLSRRIPKVLAIIIVSIAIGLSTVIFQTISNNRIITPSILGLDSLYMLIQTSIVFLLGSTHKLILNKEYNFMLTVGLMIIFSGLLYGRLLKREKEDMMNLLLVGIILGTLFQSFTGFMQMVMDPNEFNGIQNKMFASFNNINLEILKISSIFIILISIYIFKKSKELDILSLGKDQSINLGLNYNKILFQMLFLVSILVSISTALVGPMTFLGLLIVSLSREIVDNYEHKYLFIVSIMLGILFLMGAQLLVEKVMNYSIPISVIVNLIGGVYFIYLLLKENIK